MKRLLIGLGFDGKDGHTRITKGENFQLVGGSKDTHEHMQEYAIRFTEEVSKRGTSLDNVNREQLQEIHEKIFNKMK